MVLQWKVIGRDTNFAFYVYESVYLFEKGQMGTLIFFSEAARIKGSTLTRQGLKRL